MYSPLQLSTSRVRHTFWKRAHNLGEKYGSVGENAEIHIKRNNGLHPTPDILASFQPLIQTSGPDNAGK